jgi:hypothetical protein
MRKELFSVGTLTVDTIRGGGLDMFTKKFYVDPVNGSDGNPGTSLTNAKKSLAEGYRILTANKNQALCLLPGSSYHNLTSTFTWNKAFTHLIGLAGPGVYGGRCRIHDTAAFATILFSITSIGGIFKNIHWQRDYDSNLGVQNVTLGVDASYNYFEDCQFDSPIIGASLGAAAYKNLTLLDGARSETFRRCTIGQWNQTASSTSGNQLYCPGTTNGNTGTHFMDCVFMWNTSAATMKPINVADLIVEYGYILFDNCKFLGLGTSVTGLVASGKPDHGKLIFTNCSSVGVDEYDAGTNSRIYVASGTAVSGELGGKAVAIA